MIEKLPHYEIKTFDRRESFFAFLTDFAKEFNGTWEARSGAEFLDGDLERTLSFLLAIDILCNNNRAILSTVSPYFEKSISLCLKDSVKENPAYMISEMTNRNDYIYEALARMIAKKAVLDKRLRDQIVAVYKNRYPKEYDMVHDYARTYNNESNDKQKTSNQLLSIFLRTTNFEDDPHEIRFFAIHMFMIVESICGDHILPYRLIVQEMWCTDKVVLTEIDCPLDRPLMTGIFDRLNGFQDFDADKAEQILAQYSCSFISGVKPVRIYSDRAEKRKLLFNKYYKERIRLMADSLKCDRDEETVASELWNMAVDDNYAKLAAACIIAEKNSCRMQFMQDAVSYLKSNERKSYIDTIKTILPVYFAEKLEKYFDGYTPDERSRITRHEIIKDIGINDIQKDIEFFSSLGYFAAAMFLYTEMMERYYASYDMTSQFSVGSQETVLKNEIKKRDQKISSLEREIETQQKIIDVASKKDDFKARKSGDVPDDELREEIASLRKMIKDKDKEVERLEEKNADLLEYISVLETNHDSIGVSDAEIDKDKYRSLRFVFVCHDISAMYPNIRKEFPSVILMENITDNAVKGHIDAVIYVTKHISHSLYFRAKSLYEDIPSVYFSKRNTEELYKAIYDVLG